MQSDHNAAQGPQWNMGSFYAPGDGQTPPYTQNHSMAQQPCFLVCSVSLYGWGRHRFSKGCLAGAWHLISLTFSNLQMLNPNNLILFWSVFPNKLNLEWVSQLLVSARLQDPFPIREYFRSSVTKRNTIPPTSHHVPNEAEYLRVWQ